MEKERMFEIVKELFPDKTFSLRIEKWYCHPTEQKDVFYVSVHQLLPENEFDGIASGSGATWNEALKNLYFEMFSYIPAEESNGLVTGRN